MLIDLATMTALATASVGLWTVRVAVTAKGHRLAASMVAAVEATVFAVVFSRLVGRLDAFGSLAAYALGVALGTLLGLVVHARLNRSHVQLDVVAPGSSTDLVDGLHRQGWPTTSATGRGLAGPVVMASITVDEDCLDALLGDVERLAPDAFWTVHPIRAARPLPSPTG